MKKIFKIRFILLFIALTMQLSCSNYLELVPPNGLVRSEFWKTKEDVEAVVMGTYLQFASMSGNLFTYGEARGDMVSTSGYSFDNSDQRKLSESNIYATNGLCNWNSFYTAINYCNEIIKNAPEVQKLDKTFTEFQLKGFLAEAYYFRALSYFYLVRIFNDVPLVLEPSETDNNDFYPKLTKSDDVLKEMLTGLIEYRQFATTTAISPGRITKAAFDALLADIYLWNFDYENCIKYADNIIANQTIELMPSGLWFSMYYPGNSLESILEFQFNEQLQQPNAMYDLTNKDSHKYLPSQRAIELFSLLYNPADQGIRSEKVSIAMLSENNYIIWKYVGRSPDGENVRQGLTAKSCNWIVYRLADVYLMKAEALSQLSRFDEAGNILTLIRDRAQVSSLAIANSVTAYEDAIMDERAVELAFEGKRWFDLLRMGRRNNYSRKTKLVDLIIKSVPSTQKRILGAKLTNPLGWYLPIFKDEIERNNNLVQNPYYTN